MRRYQEIFLETTNQNGIDINHMLQHPHRSAPLQFVCGLGPVKANYFLNLAVNNGTKTIEQRASLCEYYKSCFQDKVYRNAVGFIKIEPPKEEMNDENYDCLDQTRIHPSCN